MRNALLAFVCFSAIALGAWLRPEPAAAMSAGMLGPSAHVLKEAAPQPIPVHFRRRYYDWCCAVPYYSTYTYHPRIYAYFPPRLAYYPPPAVYIAPVRPYPYYAPPAVYDDYYDDAFVVRGPRRWRYDW